LERLKAHFHAWTNHRTRLRNVCETILLTRGA
jgi:hypothetical protein